MYARVLSASLMGLHCERVYAEVNIELGMPVFSIVGLVNQATKESKERMNAAIRNSGYSFPDRKVIANLTPAGLRKDGSHFDLPIAIAVLLASEQIKPETDLDSTAFLGELTLDGRIDPVIGALPMVIGMQQCGIKRVVLPKANSQEAGLIEGIELYPIENLKEAIDIVEGFSAVKPLIGTGSSISSAAAVPDFADIKGQAAVKRAAQLAAAGFHGMLLIGPPGVGKSMVGKRIPGIMPPMTYSQQLECTQIYSIAGLLSENRPLVSERPFRSPHHNMSAAAMVGGGTIPHPGEVSLAHNGVLFLDELPEFNSSVLETLRQPMEDGRVTVVRSSWRCTYPSEFMLVAAMNPCRCGYYGDPVKQCSCSESDRKRYLGKVSGPMLDRIDLHVIASRPVYSDLNLDSAETMGTEELRRGVITAVGMQTERYKGSDVKNNAALSPAQIRKYCPLDRACEKLMKEAFQSLNMSARSYHRIIKVARTAADVAGRENIAEEHILEALTYRLPEDFLRS